jgi:hypothetical protein
MIVDCGVRDEELWVSSGRGATLYGVTPSRLSRRPPALSAVNRVQLAMKCCDAVMARAERLGAGAVGN